MDAICDVKDSIAGAQQFLARAEPFSRMRPEHVAWAAGRLRERAFAPEEVILGPEEFPERLYFLLSGVARLEAIGEAVPEENRLLAELIEGECFPLEALHERRPVFSTFRAATRVVCYTLEAEDFIQLQSKSDTFRDFCRERAAAFLDSSRRAFLAHFAGKSEDSSLLASRLDSLNARPPQTCLGEATIREVVAQFDRSGDDAVIIVDAQGVPLGIFTVHDLLRRVLIPGGSLEQPVSGVMSANLIVLPPDADGYDAALAMAQYGVHQVVVVDQGRLVGAVSERDLFTVQRVAMGQLSARIQHAQDLPALRILADEIRSLARNLMHQGLAAQPLMSIISSLNDRLTRRLIELTVEAHGQPLPAFCWIAIGSEGRHEQTLSTDQDNGIIFEAAAEDPQAVRERLLALARRINDGLALCGFPLCKGGIMASNPQWCLSLAEWKETFSSWLKKPEPEALLNASIFFDFRSIFGQEKLAEDLSHWLMAAAPEHPGFFRAFATQALQRTPPIGFFRDFVVGQSADHPDSLDLKLYGATLFVDAARILALTNGIHQSNTAERLSLAAEKMKIRRSEVDAWIEAFHFIQMLRLRRQYELLEQGAEPHNRIDPYGLNALDRKVFLEALRQARKLQKCLETRFAGGGGGF